MSEYKTVRYEFKASYLDQEYIPLSLQNYINHYHELSNILDYRSGNMVLAPGKTYSGVGQNFLFLACALDVSITINGNNTTVVTPPTNTTNPNNDIYFSVSEFVLVQKSTTFSFIIKPLSYTAACSNNIHYFHGIISTSS